MNDWTRYSRFTVYYLNGPHKGMFYYLYFFSALYDRSSIVDREDYEPFHTFIRYYGDLA